MRRHWLTRGTVALALAAGCWASAHGGDEAPAKSSWTAKLWPWSSAKKVPEAQKDASGKEASSPKFDQEAARRLQAETMWIRRAEVCQKLRQIAYESKDDELERFADRLDQRAWDAYVKQSNGVSMPVERVGVDFIPLEPAPKTLPNVPTSKTREVQP